MSKQVLDEFDPLASKPDETPQPEPAVQASTSESKLLPEIPPRGEAALPPKVPDAPTRATSSPAQEAMSGTATPDAVPFDFQTFLDQMKMKSAEPVARYLRSFLTNFAKKSFSVNDQIKLIHDFLDFIVERMGECEPWRTLSPAEFDNAAEAMEKLVMNRLYDYTFTPQIDRKVRQVTTDDLERDHVLKQRIGLFGWIREEHLDVPVGEGSSRFIAFAQEELLKINHYKAPRDKVICVLNCCKVIFGLIRHLNKDEGADSFIPLLIFIVLKANPPHLISNTEYINRFRRPEKLQSEAGYYMSSLMGAVSFVETMDHTSLSNITQQEFERNVEEAIQAMPPSPSPTSPTSATSPSRSTYFGDEKDTKRFLQLTGETISKPMNLIGKIVAEAFDNIEDFPGRRNERRSSLSSNSPVSPSRSQSYSHPSDYPSSSARPPYQGPIPTNYQPRIRTPSSSSIQRRAVTPEPQPRTNSGYWTPQPVHLSPASALPPSADASLRPRTPVLPPLRSPSPMDFSEMQREIDRAHSQAGDAAKETLLQIFPGSDEELVTMVLEECHGDLGMSIDRLLEMGVGMANTL